MDFWVHWSPLHPYTHTPGLLAAPVLPRSPLNLGVTPHRQKHSLSKASVHFQEMASPGVLQGLLLLLGNPPASPWCILCSCQLCCPACPQHSPVPAWAHTEHRNQTCPPLPVVSPTHTRGQHLLPSGQSIAHPGINILKAFSPLSPEMRTRFLGGLEDIQGVTTWHCLSPHTCGLLIRCTQRV